jgi:hypothetical protein
LALTAARAQVIERHQARTHRFCELDRLRQELNLLREEMRLKDARMARIPGYRRPSYQPPGRLAILELRAALEERLQGRTPGTAHPGEETGPHLGCRSDHGSDRHGILVFLAALGLAPALALLLVDRGRC